MTPGIILNIFSLKKSGARVWHIEQIVAIHYNKPHNQDPAENPAE